MSAESTRPASASARPRIGGVTAARQALRALRSRLKRRHEAGTAAQKLVAAYARDLDRLLIEAWHHLLARHDASETKIALVAVGGYGRGELHPCSDVDLMLLAGDPDDARVQALGEQWVRFLWDIGLEVGHSIRSVDDCVREAAADVTVCTNLMEARHLAGNTALTAAMEKRTASSAIWPAPAFFKAKVEEQTARHGRYNDTAYNLEPNLKEGPGGLRDIQMIAWVAQRHFGNNGLRDLVDRGFLTREEHQALIRGRNFLWRLRNGLHFMTGRREDRLLFDHQRELAQRFGYRDRPGRLAVEQLMKGYYRTVKDLRLLNDMLLQHLEEVILSPGREPVIVPLNRRFRMRDGFLETINARVFERTPFALLEVFSLMQQHPGARGLRADCIRQIRANLHRIDPQFRDDLACRTLFMEILRQPNGITRVFRAMSAYGVLGAYIPAFGRVVGQMQHDLFHVYTVDAHSLFVLRNLRRFANGEDRDDFPMLTEMMGRLIKRERLYLAALFHDLCKGRGGDHSLLGERAALSFCRRHLSEYDSRFVAWLVRHHLLMSWTAQRTDISDPQVIVRFAQTVGNQEHLDNLYLLTVADIRGTSPKVWNAWKGRLLAELYTATTRCLQRGLATPEHGDIQARELKREAATLLEGEGGPLASDLERHWSTLDTDYFLRHDAGTVAWIAREVIRARVIDLPLVSTRHLAEAGSNQFLIYAPDAENLLPVVAGGFDRMNMNIVDARIHRTRFGFALYVFAALDNSGEAVTEVDALRQIEEKLRQQIQHPRAGRDPRRAKLSRVLRHFPIPTQVTFNDAPGRQHTLMEVVAQDRPGLLYQVALALNHCKVHLLTAKIGTYGERAEDVFFITDRDGRALDDKDQLECLRKQIAAALGDPLDSGTQLADHRGASTALAGSANTETN